MTVIVIVVVVTKESRVAMSCLVTTVIIVIKTAEEASMLEQAAAQIYFRMSDREAARTVAGFPFKDRQVRERYRILLSTMPRGQFLVRHNNRFYLSKAPRITKYNT